MKYQAVSSEMNLLSVNAKRLENFPVSKTKYNNAEFFYKKIRLLKIIVHVECLIPLYLNKSFFTLFSGIFNFACSASLLMVCGRRV